ncbi:ParB/RepB/Spo0J family partition protein [Nevskia ramosa]|uniref:ParB/RepB/Spo0J family partition protein n=1 Tax=Nevskia ramosa TaxID=64002 RepID=UPI00235270B0|nr:ParB N-terminal domain-containing protein [Nevskia ramosa]
MRKLADAGVVKKADLYKVKLEDLLVEEGFNLRVKDQALEDHIESIKAAIIAGSFIPPLAVRAADGNKVLVVDGHCRREAYIRAKNEGHEIDQISCVDFKGNDADRVAAIITTASGKALSPLEMAVGVKRLRAFGKSPAEIAVMIAKTGTHVENLLLLADANSDVQKAVRDGSIAASTAIEMVRKHGEGAGGIIKSAVDKATSEGKKKVTPKMVEVALPPKKAITGIYSSLTSFAKSIPAKSLPKVDDIQEGQTITVDAKALRELLDTLEDAQSKLKKDKAKEKAKAKS